jgi:hypothetical protein
MANGIRWMIPMVDPASMRKEGYTVATMREVAERYYADEYGHPPAHTVIAKVVGQRGLYVGVGCFDAKPRKETP